jgi:hypothetical protein
VSVCFQSTTLCSSKWNRSDTQLCRRSKIGKTRFWQKSNKLFRSNKPQRLPPMTRKRIKYLNINTMLMNRQFYLPMNKLSLQALTVFPLLALVYLSASVLWSRNLNSTFFGNFSRKSSNEGNSLVCLGREGRLPSTW